MPYKTPTMQWSCTAKSPKSCPTELEGHWHRGKPTYIQPVPSKQVWWVLSLKSNSKLVIILIWPVCNVGNMHNTLDHIIRQLSELQTEFCQNHDLDKKHWERIWPTLKLMSSSEVPITSSPARLEDVGQEMISKVGTNAKHQLSNNLTLPNQRNCVFLLILPNTRNFDALSYWYIFNTLLKY